MDAQLQIAITQLFELVVKSYAGFSEYSKQRVANGEFCMEIEEGRKYIRLVKNDGQRSVHAFVDKSNGDLLKADSWKKPAKGARFNLLTDMDILKTRVDWAGSYLYK